jgi:hypothetical protein
VSYLHASRKASSFTESVIVSPRAAATVVIAPPVPTFCVDKAAIATSFVGQPPA